MHLVLHNQRIHVSALVEQLRTRRDELDKLINTFEQALDVIPELIKNMKLEVDIDSTPTSTNSIIIDSASPYVGLSVSKAAIACLQEARKPLITRDLAARLIDGGFRTQAKNFRANLETALKVRPQTFRKLAGGAWALVEWDAAA